VATSKSGGLDQRRSLPSVEQVLQRPELVRLQQEHGRDSVLRELRQALDELRTLAANDAAPAGEGLVPEVAGRVERRLRRSAAPSLVRVINATGVVVHTNLGRAPLPPDAAARVAQLAAGYSNLEYDLAAGERGDRESHVEPRLRRLTRAEAAIAVNNNAAAVLLAVNTFAEGREVLVSRGELVEIGGSFRIPDVLRKGGARLVEAGTTNRTRLADYEAALDADTGLILKVHPSNFRIVGFTEAPELAELVSLARRRGLPLVEDLGSGLIAPLPALPDEPSVSARLAAGVDVVTFSGDKLLGGPQAGLAAGRREAVDRMRRNPLYRALRVDKLTLAALEATLVDHESGLASERLPVLRLIASTADSVRARVSAMVEALRPQAGGAQLEVIPGESAVGGGAAPSVPLPTYLLSIRTASRRPDELVAELRRRRPPVVARVADDRLLLDLRTVLEEQDQELLKALGELVSIR
jgi:L-seryl-tRNA(Ser) seleniumtransferase